jgi:hypothetical protein
VPTRFIVPGITLALLVATAVALGEIESLKLEKNPISGPTVDPVFSPVCDCSQKVAHISFRLVSAGTANVTVTAGGEPVRTLVHGKHYRAGRVKLTWNGRTDAGTRAPDGVYKIRVHVGGHHRDIVLPRGTRIDSVAPKVTLASATPRTISPDGDRRNDAIALRYKLDEPAHLRLLVNGRQRVKTLRAPLSGTIRWGQPLDPKRYRLTLVAVDAAGNTTRVSAGTVLIRYVALARTTIRAKAGTKFGVRVDTDATRVTWHYLGARRAVKPGLLVLKAGRAGRHVLIVSERGHLARATVVVSPRKR